MTSSSTEVKFGVRLADCAPLKVDVLPPTVNASPVPDQKYRFRIDPTESSNVFKTLDEAKITLTADGRLSSASAKTTDEVIPLLGKALEFFVSGGTLAAADAARSAGVKAAKKASPIAAPPNECTPAAREALDARNKLGNARDALLLKQQTYIESSTFDQASGEILKAFTSALADIDKRIADADAAITTSVAVVLKPEATDAPPYKRAAFVDPSAQWKASSPSIAVKIAEKTCACGALSSGSLLFCAKLSPAEGVPTPRPPSPADVSKSEGVFYRIPIVGTVAMTVETCPQTRSNAFDKLNVAPSGSRKLRATPPRDASPTSSDLGTVDVPVPQWGPVSVLSGNFGPFGSGGVEFELDDWSVPRTVKWSAQSGGLAGLLGYAGQIQAQRAAATAPVDPADAMRANLLQRLLENCLNAPATALPDYCAGLVP